MFLQSRFILYKFGFNVFSCNFDKVTVKQAKSDGFFLCKQARVGREYE